MSLGLRRPGRSALLVLAAVGGLAAVAASPVAAANQPSPAMAPVGDFNGDGHLDFAATQDGYPITNVIAFGSSGSGIVRTPAAGGTGVVLNVQNTPDLAQARSPLPRPVRAGDVDADGYDDVIQTGSSNHSWIVYGGPGTGETIDLSIPSPRITELLNEFIVPHQVNYGIGDFNGDGYDDWIQSRTVRQQNSPGALAKTGGGALVLGGPRVAQLNTLGQGPRVIQIDTKTNQQCGVIAIWLPIVVCTYWWAKPGLEPIGDYDQDGKDDLFQPEGKFIVRGRSALATFNAHRTDASTVTVPAKPAGTPWNDPVAPPPDPSTNGMAGWKMNGLAEWITVGASANLSWNGQTDYSGSIWDLSKLVDANEIVVDFDLELRTVPGVAPGNGATLAFASRSEGGQPLARNPGIGLGWVGNKGIAIAFGNVKGTYTPSNNYVGIVNGVVGRSGYPTFVQSAPAGSPLTNATNHVTVRATGGVVTVAINGVERLRRTMALPTEAWLGFTAGVSGARQDHVIKNVVVAKP